MQFYQVCADTAKAKQSTAGYGRRLCLFCPSNKSTFDLLALKVVSESRVTWTTSVPILVFLGLSILDVRPMYATDRQTSDVRRTSSLNAPYPRGGGIIRSVHSCQVYYELSTPPPIHDDDAS